MSTLPTQRRARARTLMIQGTASSVGKSLLVTALCRYYRNQGLSVAPFKSLNMALNAHVTDDGFEMARAQAVQAEAAGIRPSVEMNPLLLKPEGDARCQVVLLGKSQGTKDAYALFGARGEPNHDVQALVLDALATLRARHDLVIIEGAGSPAEINLRSRDLANMFVAHAAEAEVLLVGDIDRGGVFASLVGTLALLEPADRARISGFLINKFRGERALLEPGLSWLTQRTQVPVLGVLPHLGRLALAEEDSLNVDRSARHAAHEAIEVVVVRLPRLSNHDEFQPFEHEPYVNLRFSDEPEALLRADLVIVPGSKSTLADLAWLRSLGLDHVLRLRAQRGQRVLGICGGCQMLGGAISDPLGVESQEREGMGLGLLPLTTQFMAEKRTQQVWLEPARDSWLTRGLTGRGPVRGYYIHAGHTQSEAPLFTVRDAAGNVRADGALSEQGSVLGSMVHGLFEDDGLRHALLAELRRERGLSAQVGTPTRREVEYDRLAQAIEAHVDRAFLQRFMA